MPLPPFPLRVTNIRRPISKAAEDAGTLHTDFRPQISQISAASSSGDAYGKMTHQWDNGLKTLTGKAQKKHERNHKCENNANSYNKMWWGLSGV